MTSPVFPTGTKLCLRAVHCVSSESSGFTGFPLPHAGQRACWLHILIPLSLPPSLHPRVLFTLRSPVAVPPQRLSRPPRSWQLPRIGQLRPSAWIQRGEVLQWLGGVDVLYYGTVKTVRVWLNVASPWHSKYIYRLLNCVANWFL